MKLVLKAKTSIADPQVYPRLQQKSVDTLKPEATLYTTARGSEIALPLGTYQILESVKIPNEPNLKVLLGNRRFATLVNLTFVLFVSTILCVLRFATWQTSQNSSLHVSRTEIVRSRSWLMSYEINWMTSRSSHEASSKIRAASNTITADDHYLQTLLRQLNFPGLVRAYH